MEQKTKLKKFEGIYGTLDHITVEARDREEALEILPAYVVSPILGALHIVRELN